LDCIRVNTRLIRISESLLLISENDLVVEHDPDTICGPITMLDWGGSGELGGRYY